MTEKIMIHSDYDINKNTAAIIPAKHFDYDTIVLEKGQKLYIKQRSMSMIKAACLDGGADYDGRRRAVIHLTDAEHKVPIPINPAEHIFAFPTHSAKHYDCHWIFYHHVKSIKPHPKSSGASIITFKNFDEPLILNISCNRLQKQMRRTSYCIVRFTHLPIKPIHPAFEHHF